MKIIYEDGSFSETKCIRSRQTTPEERARDYEKFGRVAMDRGDWNKSDTYFELARLEELKATTK